VGFNAPGLLETGIPCKPINWEIGLIQPCILWLGHKLLGLVSFRMQAHKYFFTPSTQFASYNLESISLCNFSSKNCNSNQNRDKYTV
jgi:hypothetical protein